MKKLFNKIYNIFKGDAANYTPHYTYYCNSYNELRNNLIDLYKLFYALKDNRSYYYTQTLDEEIILNQQIIYAYAKNNPYYMQKIDYITLMDTAHELYKKDLKDNAGLFLDFNK